MIGEIICVGTELLLGDIVNTNAAFLSAQLSELGINLYNQTVIGDNPARLSKCISSALKSCDILILTGGLGPTLDDITKETVAEVCGLDLIEDKSVLLDLENYYARQNRAIPSGVEKQALVPKGASIIKNKFGTAPGLLVNYGEKKIIMLPGPPREMQPMFLNEVKPLLLSITDNLIISNSLYVYGMGESEVANRLGKKLLNSKNPTVATYAKDSEVQVRVTVSSTSKGEANALLNSTVNSIKSILGDAIYSNTESGLQNTAVALLNKKKLKVATAESCTAGMLSKSITEVSGSSNVFEMGISAYANDIKIKVLNVPKEIIATRGAVSAETAALMAKGIRDAANSDIGIGITGVAGPTSSENKPVGLVYISLTDGKNIWVRKLNAAFNNDRERVRNAATLAALDLIRRYCLSTPQIMGGGTTLGDKLVVCTSPFDFTYPIIEEKEPEQTEIKIEGKPPIPVMEFQSDESDELIKLLLKDEELIEQTELPQAEDNIAYITEHIEKKEQNAFIRFLKSILPWKNDPVKEIIRKIILLIALITFISTGIYLINYFNQGNINGDLVSDARAIYTAGGDALNKDGMLIKFEELYKKNNDICGWLAIDGTKIDYPVYQTNDNEFYVTHDMSKSPSRYGAIFADTNATIAKDTRSKNIVLYGHNMLDHSMFGGILDYTKLSFYKENPLIEFDSLYDSNTYKVFAVIVTNVNKEDDNGYVFNYIQNRFSSESNFLNWIENIKVRSVINTGVGVIGSDEIITLSTCSYQFDDARTVVFARKVRQGESMHTNTSNAKYNKIPLYPQAYYDKNGGKKPDIEIEQYTGTLSTTVEKIEVTSSITANTSSINEDNLDNTKNDKPEDTNAKKIKVSNYVGLSLLEAIEKINEQGLHVESVEYNGEDVDENKVLAQNVKENQMIAEGSGIVLTVSGNAKEITVPDFVGMTLKEAENKASEVGLSLSVMSIGSKLKKNTVLIQSVPAETVTEERSIIIYISNGTNEVPDVIGLKTSKAKQEMKKFGFSVKVKKKEVTDSSQVGIIVSLSVTPHTYASTTKKIVLYEGKKKSSVSGDKESSSKETTTSNTSSASSNTNSESSKETSTSTPSATSSVATSSVAASSTPASSVPPNTPSKPSSSNNDDSEQKG